MPTRARRGSKYVPTTPWSPGSKYNRRKWRWPLRANFRGSRRRDQERAIKDQES